MFWFLHYSAKVLLGLGILGMGYIVYDNRQWFAPADRWVQTLQRVQTETLPVIGVSAGKVIHVSSGDSLVVLSEHSRPQYFRIAGIAAPPPSRNPLSDRAGVFRASRDRLKEIALSNEVHIAYTFYVPGGGGIGAVTSGGTNLAVPLLWDGVAWIQDSTLKCLPVTEQVQLLAAEKDAREARRGLWKDPAALDRIKGSNSGSR